MPDVYNYIDIYEIDMRAYSDLECGLQKRFLNKNNRSK